MATWPFGQTDGPPRVFQVSRLAVLVSARAGRQSEGGLTAERPAGIAAPARVVHPSRDHQGLAGPGVALGR